MKTLSSLSLVAALLLAPALAFAQTDAVSFGSSVHVPAGQVVRDAVAFGGDAVVAGTVRGDATAFGGSVILEPSAEVTGDATSFGGSVIDRRVTSASPPPSAAPATPAAAHPARGDGPLDGLVSWVKDTARSAMAHVMLFLLGLLMISVSRERLGALQATMIKDAPKTVGWGLLGYVAAAVATILLALTVVGIPVAVLVALALPVATYVGLAAAATVIGAALPIERLQGREVAQLAAGVAVLFAASLVPVAGGIAVAIAACLGFGAVLRTRLAKDPPADLPEGPVGGVPEGAASHA